MPGANDQKPRVNFLLLGRRTALMVCQAMSIAMTVVLPAPVASFRARRSEFGVGGCSLALEVIRKRGRLPSRWLRRDLGQPDRGLDRLDLAEERSDVVER
jgi:hypothetical protein